MNAPKTSKRPALEPALALQDFPLSEIPLGASRPKLVIPAFADKARVNMKRVIRWASKVEPRLEPDNESIVEEIIDGIDSSNFFFVCPPSFVLTLRQSVIEALKNMQATTGKSPNWGDAVRIGVSDGDGALTDFSEDAINRQVEAYYRLKDAFSEESDIANMLTTNRFINSAIMECLLSRVPDREARFLELSAGPDQSRPIIFSEYLAGIHHPPILYTTTDFTLRPDEQSPARLSKPGLEFIPEVMNLFDPLPSLPSASRYDGMLITYGFDCMWMPGDTCYEEVDGDWYKYKYRLVAPDWHPNRERLIRTFQLNEDPAWMSMEDVAAIAIETISEKVDIDKEPHGDLIKARAKGQDWCLVSSPWGWVQKIQEAIENQLKPSGQFVSVDLGVFYKDELPDVPFNTCGVAAKHKVEDLRLARDMLRKAGYWAEVVPLSQFVHQFLDGQDWCEHATSDEAGEVMSESHFVLRAGKRPA